MGPSASARENRRRLAAESLLIAPSSVDAVVPPGRLWHGPFFHHPFALTDTPIGLDSGPPSPVSSLFRLIPPEILNIVAQFFCCDVSSLLRFSLLSRKCRDVVRKSGDVWPFLLSYRFPDTPLLENPRAARNEFFACYRRLSNYFVDFEMHPCVETHAATSSLSANSSENSDSDDERPQKAAMLPISAKLLNELRQGTICEGWLLPDERYLRRMTPDLFSGMFCWFASGSSFCTVHEEFESLFLVGWDRIQSLDEVVDHVASSEVDFRGGKSETDSDFDGFYKPVRVLNLRRDERNSVFRIDRSLGDPDIEKEDPPFVKTRAIAVPVSRDPERTHNWQHKELKKLELKDLTPLISDRVLSFVRDGQMCDPLGNFFSLVVHFLLRLDPLYKFRETRVRVWSRHNRQPADVKTWWIDCKPLPEDLEGSLFQRRTSVDGKYSLPNTQEWCDPLPGEVFRRGFLYEVRFWPAEYINHADNRYGEGILAVSENGYVLELHDLVFKYREGELMS